MSIVTAAALRQTIKVGGSVHDAVATINGLTVRIWWEAEQTPPAGEPAAYGWRWSIAGEGPDVWYQSVDRLFDTLAEHWGAIEAEAKGETVPVDLREAIEANRRLQAKLDAVTAQRDTAWGDITRIAAERDTVQETARERLLALHRVEQERETLRHHIRNLDGRLDAALTMRDEAVIERDAIHAKLAWAQDELSKVWSALRTLR